MSHTVKQSKSKSLFFVMSREKIVRVYMRYEDAYKEAGKLNKVQGEAECVC